MKCRNFRITKRRHLLLVLNPLYDWIVNQISLNTSKGNYKINQVGRKQKVLDPSPESWARTPQQPPSASVEKLWKIMKNDEIFEFPPKLKVLDRLRIANKLAEISKRLSPRDPRRLDDRSNQVWLPPNISSYPS